MRRIEDPTRKQVLDLCLKGYTYQQISNKLQISAGVISTIIGEFRKKTPDLDQLRKLSIKLENYDLDVYDAIWGANLMIKLREFGISPHQIEDLILISEKFCKEKNLDKPKFGNLIIRLMREEEKTNRPFEQILEDKCNKYEENRILEQKNKVLRKKCQDKEQILKEQDKRNKKIEAEVITRVGIKNIGLDSFAKTLIQICALKSLNLNPEELSELDRLKILLNKKKITPQNLQTQIQNGIFQESEKNHRTLELNRLKQEITEYKNQKKKLRGKCFYLMFYDNILTAKKLSVFCPQCRSPIKYPLHTKEEISYLINTNRQICFFCVRCQKWQMISPRQFLVDFGWQLLPNSH